MKLVQIYCLTFWCAVANYDLQVQTCCHSCHGMDTEAMDSRTDRVSTLRADALLQCCVIMFGITLKLKAFWKVIYSTLMFWKVFLVMLSITSEKTCRPEISIRIHASSIDSTKCQKEKSQSHILVQMFCTGKNVLNCIVWETFLCRVHFSVLLSPH